MKHMVVFLAKGFEEIEAITVIDLLRRAGIRVTTIALDAQDVEGAHGVIVRADTMLTAMPQEYDGIVLPGGTPGTKNLMASAEVRELVQKAFHDGSICAAICAAPSVFSMAGILNGKRATCYPGVEDQFDGARYIDAAVVRDGTILTGRSAGTALPFALELIAMITDQDTADQIRTQIHY